MRLKVERKWRKDTYTIGRLFIDGEFFCNTLEDKDRGLKQSDTIEQIKKVKVYSETAIPIGTYSIEMDVVSPKYRSVQWYKDLCEGKMPRLIDVPGFEGILIHPGTSALDSAGCLLVGENKGNGKLLNSRVTFSKLYAKMNKAHKNGEEITIEYVW
ncbi:MAG: DUF5675 family protein [Candidatus Cryptobacteroides sp.]